MADCIFCKIASKEIPSYSLWEDDHFFTFLDIRPLNPGQLLIIPKDHAELVYDLADDAYRDAFAVTRHLAAPLQRATDAKRIAIVVEGFDVPHAHIKLIPLHHGHELTPERAYDASKEELEAMQKKIKNEIESLK